MTRATIRSDTQTPTRRLMLRGVNVTEADIQSVFSWLSVWEVAAPLKSYSHLACDEGTAAERRLTAKVIGDLRQMLYDSRAIWFRVDNERAQRFLAALDVERKRCKCAEPCELAFLRALWKVKPLMLALPTGFIQPGPTAPIPLKSEPEDCCGGEPATSTTCDKCGCREAGNASFACVRHNK